MNNSTCSCGNPRFRQRRRARRRQQGFYIPADHNPFIFEAETFSFYRQPAGELAAYEQWTGLETGDGTEAFLGGLARAAKKAAKTVSRTARDVGRTVSKIDRVIPVSQIAKTAVSLSPMGMALRAGVGAIGAAAQGKNILHGAARSLGDTPVNRFLIDTAGGVVRGENVIKAAKRAAQAGI